MITSYAIGDTYIDSREPHEAHGEATSNLIGQSPKGTGAQTVYLIFDLSDIVPEGCVGSVTSVELHMELLDNLVNVTEIVAHPVEEHWSEGEITYHNSPELNTNTTLFTANPWHGSNVYSGEELDKAVEKWINHPGENYGMALKATASYFAIDQFDGYYSIETKYPPFLKFHLTTRSITQNTPPKDGLKAYYPFNNNAQDESGNGNHGMVSGATLTEDRCGIPDSAYSFDGNDYIQFNTPVLSTPPVSVAFWMKTDALSHENRYLISNGAQTYNSQGLSFIMLGTASKPCHSSYPTGGAIGFVANQNSNLRPFVIAPISTGQWHHIVGIWDGIIDPDHILLYIDGVPVAADTCIATLGNSPGPPNNMKIGNPSNVNTPVYSFDGQIDEVYLYNRLLTDHEIKMLYSDKDKCTNNDLLVTLSNFTVNLFGNKTIQANWLTGTEENNDGMNVWCAQMKNNQFEHITRLNGKKPISTGAIFPFSGNHYSVSNEVKPEGVYYCALEDIDSFGECTTHCEQMKAVIVGNVTPRVELDDAKKLCHDGFRGLKEARQLGVCVEELLARSP